MRIAILIEGKTEQAFLPHLRTFLQKHLAGRMPKLDPVPFDGRLPKADKLRREVERLLKDAARPADAVIAITDVYTGTSPPEFVDADDAKAKMRQWVGSNGAFYPHAAQYDFEAWLLPFWSEVVSLAGSNRVCPAANPEQVNHSRPPAFLLREVFRTGSKGRSYVKVRDASRILQNKDLLTAANSCRELKALINTILTLCGATAIT